MKLRREELSRSQSSTKRQLINSKLIMTHDVGWQGEPITQCSCRLSSVQHRVRDLDELEKLNDLSDLQPVLWACLLHEDLSRVIESVTVSEDRHSSLVELVVEIGLLGVDLLLQGSALCNQSLQLFPVA